jgi:hypothetical protein
VFTALTFSVLLGLLPAVGHEKQEQTPLPKQELGTRVTVGPGAISVPEGVVVLVRKGDKVGALKFSAIKPDPEKFKGAAEYESVFQGDGSGSFSKGNVVVKKGKVHEKPLVGIGRLAFQTGRTTLHIGPFKFYYRFPTWVDMWPAVWSSPNLGTA